VVLSPDGKLVTRARQGDRDAYRVLVERYQRRVFHLAYSLLRNREDAADVSQEAFVKVFVHLNAFKGDSSTEIRGALIGSETNPLEPGRYFEYYNRTTDTMLIRASQQNVDMALNVLYNMRVTSYREVCNSPPC
jgi:hypothetical protein